MDDRQRKRRGIKNLESLTKQSARSSSLEVTSRKKTSGREISGMTYGDDKVSIVAAEGLEEGDEGGKLSEKSRPKS